MDSVRAKQAGMAYGSPRSDYHKARLSLVNSGRFMGLSRYGFAATRISTVSSSRESPARVLGALMSMGSKPF